MLLPGVLTVELHHGTVFTFKGKKLVTMMEQKKETRHGKHRPDKRNVMFWLTEAERNLAHEVARLEGYENLTAMFRGLIKERMAERQKRQGGCDE